MKHLKTFNQLNESIFSRLFRRNRNQETQTEEPKESEVDSDLANIPEYIKDMFMHMYQHGFMYPDIEEFAHFCAAHYGSDEIGRAHV